MNKDMARDAGPALLKGGYPCGCHLNGLTAFSQPRSNVPIDCCHW
jgi:hypothetical protein